MMRQGAISFVAAVALLAMCALTCSQRADSQLLQFPQRPELVLFSADWCKPCHDFKADARKGVITFQTTVSIDVRQFRRQPDGTHFRVVEAVNGKWTSPATAAAAQRATGKPVSSLPTFWISGTSFRAEGYERK